MQSLEPRTRWDVDVRKRKASLSNYKSSLNKALCHGAGESVAAATLSPLSRSGHTDVAHLQQTIYLCWVEAGAQRARRASAGRDQTPTSSPDAGHI